VVPRVEPLIGAQYASAMAGLTSMKFAAPVSVDGGKVGVRIQEVEEGVNMHICNRRIKQKLEWNGMGRGENRTKTKQQHIPKSIGCVMTKSPNFKTTSSTVQDPSVALLILAFIRSPLYRSRSTYPNASVPFSKSGCRFTVNRGESRLDWMVSMNVLD
jgi:hypothetical protein